MANINTNNLDLEKKKMKSPKSDLGEIVDFGNELNKHLTNAIFKLDASALEIEDKEKSLIDLYQIAEKWIKLKFKKSGKTWIVDEDSFASNAGKILCKVVDDPKLVEAIEKKATKLEEDGEIKIPIKVELQWWMSDINKMTFDDAKDLCKNIWNNLVAGVWALSIEDKITDQNISRDIYHSIVNPFKQDGTQCKNGEFITIEKPFRSCWYTDGKYVPGSSVQIWHRAIDPIAWFGKQITEKPKTFSSYDSIEVALELPTKEIEDASLAEDEAFGYAK